MRKVFRVFLLLFSLSFFMFSCKEKTSLLRVFVRKADGNPLDEGLKATVIITNDPNSTPPSAKFSAKDQTNGNKVEFNLNTFFSAQKAAYGDTVREGYLKINAALDELEGDTIVRVTYGTTSVQTIYLNKK